MFPWISQCNCKFSNNNNNNKFIRGLGNGVKCFLPGNCIVTRRPWTSILACGPYFSGHFCLLETCPSQRWSFWRVGLGTPCDCFNPLFTWVEAIAELTECHSMSKLVTFGFALLPISVSQLPLLFLCSTCLKYSTSSPQTHPSCNLYSCCLPLWPVSMIFNSEIHYPLLLVRVA